MNEPMTDVPLAAEFAPASLAQWRELVDRMLKGTPFDGKLIAKTHDGLRIEPLYAGRADTHPVDGRPPGTPWEVVQRIDHRDPAAANQQALQDLENGATGLTLAFAGAPGTHGFGLDPSATALRRVFDGIHLDAGIAIEFNGAPFPLAAEFAAIIAARAIQPSATHIRFGFDPLGRMARDGATMLGWTDMAAALAAAIGALTKQGFPGPFAAADGRVIHAAGGSEAQELAYVLASAVGYLRALDTGGISIDPARRLIFFRLAADADQFLTIAKFRALRKLFARIETACGVTPEPIFISAETGWRMMTKRDPWVNVLRATMAVFAAGLGGADSISVLPFTAALGLPDAFARRLARNTQLILLEEANLAKVADPAAGSGGFEALTDQLCAAAWTLFQEIEAAGAGHAALAGGLVQRKVAAVRSEREPAAARGREPLTGTSEFPDIHELPVAVLELAPPESPPAAAPGSRALPEIRLATPFEQLRDQADQILAATGARPRIFLANLGTPSDFTARATFAKNFFEAGGIEAVTNDGITDAKELADAFRASGAHLACLCSSNDIYGKDAVAAAAELIKAGAHHIYLAGRPGELEAALKAAGIRTFIYAGCDMLATLRAAHDMVRV